MFKNARRLFITFMVVSSIVGVVFDYVKNEKNNDDDHDKPDIEKEKEQYSQLYDDINEGNIKEEETVEEAQSDVKKKSVVTKAKDTVSGGMKSVSDGVKSINNGVKSVSEGVKSATDGVRNFSKRIRRRGRKHRRDF